MICTTSLLLYGIYIKFTSAVPQLLLPSSGPPSRRSARINMYKSLFGGKIEFRNRKESLKGLTSLASQDRRNLPTILREKAKSILKMKSQISCFSLRMSPAPQMFLLRERHSMKAVVLFGFHWCGLFYTF